MMHKMTAMVSGVQNAIGQRIILLLAALALAPAFVGSGVCGGSIHSPQETGSFSFANRVPQWSADGQSIVVNLDYRIYQVSADGSSVARIPDNGADGQFGPSVSPDGRIAYMDATEYEPRLTTVNSDSGRQKHHTWRGIDEIAGIPAWSPDGRYVAFTARVRNNIDPDHRGRFVKQATLMDEKGSLTAAYQPSFPAFSGRERPVWSNDSKQVAFSWYCHHRCIVTVMDTDGNGKTVVDAAAIAKPGQDEFQARGALSSVAWSPDDRTIYYALKQGRHLPTILYSTNLSTLATRHIIDLGTREIDHLAISPDGGKLLFGKSDLFIIDVDGTGLRDLTGAVPQLQTGRPGNMPASWSPDGSTLYTTAPDGSNFRELTSYDTDRNVVPANARP